MPDKPDVLLLREYAEHGRDDAFREIVIRYTDLVYSAALRQLDSREVAQDIAQGVFTDLARKAQSVADRLSADASLVGWLYRSTRFATLKHLRDDHRRATHERLAMEHLMTDSESAPEWERIRPLLDEVMDALSDDERDAVLLRFFKNHDFRAVGVALGISDDAAQKRVSRAVDRLRELFAKRGVTVGAGGLAAVLTANAVQAAPAGMAIAISSAAALAGTAVTTTTITTATKAIAMTTLQKAAVTTALVIAAGAGIYEARQASLLHDQVQALQQQQAPLADQISQLQRERDDATNRLAALLAENEQSKSGRNTTELLKLRGEVSDLRNLNRELSAATNDPNAALVQSWLERERQLRQLVQQHQDKAIPELQLLTEQDWLDAAMNAKFDTEKDVRRSLANLRSTAENHFTGMLHDAVSEYMKANNGGFPTDLSQLQPYFKTPVDNAILDRWEVVPQSALPNQNMGGDWVITEKAPVDADMDNRWAVGPSGYGSTSYPSAETGDAIKTLTPVLKAYAAANNGQQPTSPSQLVPYLSTPEQKAAYQKMLDKFSTNP